MPVDLFQPMVGVQTSIYIFEHTGKPHDYEKQVRFIDFRSDGYKRAKRAISEIDSPIERYQDIVQIYKNGRDAKVHEGLWDLDSIVVMDEITDSGKDWNFDQHLKIDTRPIENDFREVVSKYLSWEVSQVLQRELHAKNLSQVRKSLEQTEFTDVSFKERDFAIDNQRTLKKFRVGDLFSVSTGSLVSAARLRAGNIPRISAKSEDNGVFGYFDTEYINESRHFENFITVNFFGAHGGIFYHPYRASVEMKVHVLKLPNHVFTRRTGLYLVSALKKAIGNFSYGEQLSSSKLKDGDFFVELPVDETGQIDFAHMEDYIFTIEVAHIRELAEYFKRELAEYFKVVGISGFSLA